MVERTSRLAIVFVCLSLFATPAWAGETAPLEARALIERQLDAFAHDDAEGAYALAAPGIRMLFTDSETFMAMVRQGYAPVYRHRSVEFGAFAEDGDKIEQSLTIVDEDNNVWNAIYYLERQPDGTWRTNGCVLTKSTESSL
jgi:DNA-binding transcriptional LysR family regulator